MIAQVDVNAKNSFGGYTGSEPYLFAWKDGRMYAYRFASAGWDYVD